MAPTRESLGRCRTVQVVLSHGVDITTPLEPRLVRPSTGVITQQIHRAQSQHAPTGPSNTEPQHCPDSISVCQWEKTPSLPHQQCVASPPKPSAPVFNVPSGDFALAAAGAHPRSSHRQRRASPQPAVCSPPPYLLAAPLPRQQGMPRDLNRHVHPCISVAPL